jgi:hypothetical protein
MQLSELREGDRITHTEVYGDTLNGTVEKVERGPSGGVNLNVGGRHFVGLAPYWSVQIEKGNGQ